MAFPAQHYLALCMGDGYNATEQWQFGFRLAATDPSAPPTQAQANAIRDAFVTAWNATFHCRFLRFTQIKLTWLTTAGLIVPGFVPVFGIPAAPVAGTEAGGNLSHIIPQGAHALTLRTAIVRGHASHGRVYLPPVCSTLQTDGRITQAQCDLMASNYGGFLTSINTIAGISSAVVMSRVGAGASAAVTSVQMGRVVDTQRRRRRSLAETPLSSVTVVP